MYSSNATIVLLNAEYAILEFNHLLYLLNSSVSCTQNQNMLYELVAGFVSSGQTRSFLAHVLSVKPSLQRQRGDFEEAEWTE